MNLFQEVQKNSEGTFLQKSPEKISKEFPKEHPEESLEKFQDELLEELLEECIETPRGSSGSAFEGTLRKSCGALGETTNRTSGETTRGTAGENARVISKGIPGETTIRTFSYELLEELLHKLSEKLLEKLSELLLEKVEEEL